MMEFRFFRHLALLGCGVLLTACVGAPERPVSTADVTPDTPYTLERFRGEAKLADGVDTVVFDNPYGDIQVRQTGAAALAWQGVEQRIGSKPRQARIESFVDVARQGVRVRYAEHDAATPANPRLGRVDLYVFVPKGVKVDLRSDFGTINIRRVNDEIRARSRSGNIIAASRGSLDAASDTGEIRVWTMQSAGETRVRTSGNVIADIPVFDDVSVQATASTGVRADFQLDDLRQDERGMWQASWRHGSPSHRMEFHSSAGEVLLQALRQPIR